MPEWAARWWHRDLVWDDHDTDNGVEDDRDGREDLPWGIDDD